MLQTNDVGVLFASMQASYGHTWAHKGDAIPVWQKRLSRFNSADVMRAAEKALAIYPDFPPTLGQFADLVDYNQPLLPDASGRSQEDQTKAERIYAYTMPKSERQNPGGNPHHIKLPESIAHRKAGEAVDKYEKRISDAVTFALYPKLGFDGRSTSNYS